MLSSPALSLLNLSAQSSVVQSGRATTVTALVISGANSGPLRGDSMHALRKGTDEAAAQVKSPATLLREQMAKVLDQLKAGVDAVGETLRDTWAGAVDSGQIAFDRDTSLYDMKGLADKEGVLPDGLRAMVLSYHEAQTSLMKLEVEGFKIQLEAQEKENKASMANYNMLVGQAINDLATAMLVSDSASDGSADGARTALQLIKAARDWKGGSASGSEADDQSQAMSEIMDQARALALQAKHAALVKDIRGMIARGELGIGMISETYWGEVDVSTDAPAGQGMMVYQQQKDVLTAVSVSASLSGGWSIKL